MAQNEASQALKLFPLCFFSESYIVLIIKSLSLT